MITLSKVGKFFTNNSFRIILRDYSIEKNELELEQLKDKHCGITVLSLNRKLQKNALGKQLVAGLHEKLDALSYEPKTRVLIIRSLVPGVFCAGADLKERESMEAPAILQFLKQLNDAVNKVHNLPVPVICALDGLALGGGLELALACDLRIASDNCKMGLVEGRLAIIPGAGGTQRLPRLTGPAIAKELIYTAKIIDAEQARKYGIINRVVPQNADRNAAFLRAVQMAEDILPNGPLAIKMAKCAINNGLEVDLKNGLAIEASAYNQIIPTKDRVEGLKAFKEKRSPVYRGE